MAPAAVTKLLYSRQLWAVSSEAPPDLSTCKFQIYGYLLRMGVRLGGSHQSRVYHRRGRLIGESQERVARAKPLTGDEVEQLVGFEITS